MFFVSIFQKKDYELALVGAFKREKEKDKALQALAAENEAAMRLVRPTPIFLSKLELPKRKTAQIS